MPRSHYFSDATLTTWLARFPIDYQTLLALSQQSASSNIQHADLHHDKHKQFISL